MYVKHMNESEGIRSVVSRFVCLKAVNPADTEFRQACLWFSVFLIPSLV
jgi:hypothetical protein